MVTIKIKENSKQAKAVLEMLKTFSFVEFLETGLSAPKITRKSKVLSDLDTAFKQLKEAKEGKLKRKTLDELFITL